jgi:hypothetical protein
MDEVQDMLHSEAYCSSSVYQHNQTCASKIQWQDIHRTDIIISKEEIRKKTEEQI